MTKTGYIYRAIYGRLKGRPTNFSWIIKGVLAASGRPTSREEIEWLTKQGIRSILTLTETNLPHTWLNGINYRHIPMDDHKPPPIDRLCEAARFIHEQIGQKNPILVHCAAGLGRTGTTLAAYLIKYREMSVDAAIRYIRSLRPGSIEEAQVETLATLAKNGRPHT